MKRKAKIIATLGPSSSTIERISELIQAGIDVARLNFSHGTHDSHKQLISNLNELSVNIGKQITILQDLQGPKLRVGTLPQDGVELSAGEILSFELDKHDNAKDYSFKAGKSKKIYLDVPDILHCLEKGGKILIDDGKIELEIIEIPENGIRARVILGGILKSNKGVNLPGTNLDIPGFTEKDKSDLEFGLSLGVDAVAISFVHSADDIHEVRKFIERKDSTKSGLPIIAKLELPDAVKNLNEILDAADGVMVARGDLAVETSPSEVPIIQKKIIHAANKKAKLVITATQMLDSMISNPRPTRAEASDVANAILDGSDALMLSGETAIGRYPVESVRMMDKIILEAEESVDQWGHYYQSSIGKDQDDASAISIAARELAYDRDVCSVAVFTQSGKSAILQSKARPEVPIFAFTPNELTFRRLGLYWGVIPHLVPHSDSLEKMIRFVEKELISTTTYSPGQKIVLICGFPVGMMRSTNLALIHTIGSLDSA